MELADLPPPSVSFGSDNSSGVLPEVLEALERANTGHVPAYGDDPYTARCVEDFRSLFGAPVEVLLVWGGTGANVVGLASMLRASDAVVCAAGAHINVDEGGAPERFLGAKLIDVATPDGKLGPDDVLSQLWATTGASGDEHHAQPRVVSITQSTELGTVYRPEEIGALGEVAHGHDMYLHLDGARIANATVALGCDLATFTSEAGVDVVSFGGAKNGMMYGEAVVFLNLELAQRARFIRKQAMQLPSKSRYIAAQFTALLSDGLWLRVAAHANEMAARLHAATTGIAGVVYDRVPEANSCFPYLPPGAIELLAQWCHFYAWDAPANQARWMTTWDTGSEDVDRFAAGVGAVLSRRG